MFRALVRTAAVLVLAVAAAGIGYWVSTQLGEDLLRAEAERQLARLLKGEVEIERLQIGDFGLKLQGRNVRVYPRGEHHGLTADFVEADIDPLSLVVGRFRLKRLLVEGGHFSIERDAESRWSPYPIAALDRRSEEASASAEDGRSFPVLRAFEAATRYLVENAEIARLLIVRDGLVTFVDQAPPGGESVEMALVELRGTLDHRWLSDQPEVAVNAVFVDTDGHRSRIEVEGRNGSDDVPRITVAATDLEVDAFQPYAMALGPEAQVAGRLSGTFSFETPEQGSSVAEIDWVTSQLVCAFPRRQAQVRFESPEAHLEIRLEAQPGRVRLAKAHIRGHEVEIDADAFIERPLRDSSQARLAIAVRGTELPEVRRVIDSLPASDREPLERFLAPIRSARIVEVHGSGTTRLAAWRELLAGQLDTLPPGFLLGASVDDLSVEMGDGSVRATDVSGRIDWSADRIEIRDVHGLLNGEPTPEVDVVVDGFVRLFAADDEKPELEEAAPDLPGLAALRDIAADLGGDRDTETAAGFPAVDLNVDLLRHPALRWPFRDGRLTLKSSERSVQLSVHEGLWSDAPIRGELVWTNEPDPRVSIGLEVLARAQSPTSPTSPTPPARSARSARSADDPTLLPSPPIAGAPAAPSTPPWFEGDFQVEAAVDGPLGFRELGGHFAAVDDSLYFTGVRAALAPEGELRSDLSLDLASPERVGLVAGFELDHGNLGRIAGIVPTSDDFATGTLKLRGSVDGQVQPGLGLLNGLDGVVWIRAKNGEIRRRIPLVVAMATATEGFNPFASREGLAYERVETTLELKQGLISSERLVVEGPVRVFASGGLDLRAEPATIDAVVGVFLFRQADLMLGKLPLLKNLISDKGLVGAYFEMTGLLDAPRVRTLPGKTLSESMPSVIKAPFRVLEFLLSPPSSDGDEDETHPHARPGPGRMRKRVPSIPAPLEEPPPAPLEETLPGPTPAPLEETLPAPTASP